MFLFKYHLIEELPKLAWLAEIEKSTKVITVLHGKHVECKNDFFVSGVWDGEFDRGDFDRSSVFWGTGAKLSQEGVTFATPSHSLERLVYAEDDNYITFSNSPTFLLAYKDYSLDRNIDQYEQILCSVLRGPEKCCETIPLEYRKSMRQAIVSLIKIGFDMKIRLERRPELEEFKSFNDYYGRMMLSMKSIKKNSVALSRVRMRYGVISTISSGYDSATCAAVAKQLGCETVVTLSNGKYDKDSGEEIAKQLRYQNIIKRDCNIYKDKKGCIDAEYLSSGEQATHLQFSVFEDIFANNIVFYGCRGSYWDKSSQITDSFEMVGYYYYETDTSWTENSLKNGYINGPLPTFGSSKCTSIRDISNSEEMLPWTLNTSYDKPIPRRILEECGVKRETFGMVKYGGGFSLCYDTKKSLKNKMSIEGYSSFLEYERQFKKNAIRRFVRQIIFINKAFPVYWNVAARKLNIKLKLQNRPIKMTNPGTPSDLIFWSVDVMKKRYSDMIRNHK